MTPTERKKANTIAEAARQMIDGKPDIERAMRDAWDQVAQMIAIHFNQSDRLHKAYARSNALRDGRLAMLTEFVAGKTVEECSIAALASAGLDKHGNPIAKEPAE